VCNLYSMTKSQAAIRAIVRAMRDQTGNLPPLPCIFPVLWRKRHKTFDAPRPFVMETARAGPAGGINRGPTRAASPLLTQATLSQRLGAP
jgi:hypothetical protein